MLKDAVAVALAPARAPAVLPRGGEGGAAAVSDQGPAVCASAPPAGKSCLTSRGNPALK